MVGNNEWQTYTPEQVRAVMNDLHVEILGEAGDELQGFCPFHYNRSSPAFSISTETGMWYCFNPTCGKTGTLEQLIIGLTGKTLYEARRIIAKRGSETFEHYTARIQQNIEPFKFTEYDPAKIDALYDNFWQSDEAQAYMHGRHFTDETLHKFKVGFGETLYKNQPCKMVNVPFYDPEGMPIGLIGRSIEGKDFKYSPGLKKSKTLFNLHRAKKHESIIVVEASFSAMRIDQAGYENVVAVCGGSLSKEQADLLNKHFSIIIIMTDKDPKPTSPGHYAGYDLGMQIHAACMKKRVLWGTQEYEWYPTAPLEGYRDKPAKDPDDMCDEEILRAIRNPITTFEFMQRFAPV